MSHNRGPMTLLILVRHAAATGQDPSRPLTEVGSEQAQKVASFIKEFYWVDHIFSSPFVRALKTAEPLAKQFSLDVKIDDRLRERVLYRDVAPVDWKSELAKSFDDFEYRCNGGETNGEGRERAISFLNELPRGANSVVVSHGNLCALLLGLFMPFGCHDLLNLSNPDIFAIDLELKKVHRIWSNEGIPAIRMRPSARAILLDHQEEKVFLFHVDIPEARFPKHPQVRRLWITPGGGLDEGESVKTTLSRELWEEMGLKESDYEILGHLWTGKRATSWEGCAQYCLDDYYVVKLLRGDFAMNFANHTEQERRAVIDHKWWTLAELAETAEPILPRQLKGFKPSHPLQHQILAQDF